MSENNSDGDSQFWAEFDDVSEELREAMTLADPFQGGDLVKQSNALTDAAYKLSIHGKRVLWLCLTDVVRKGAANHHGIFRLSARDYRKRFGGSYEHSARDLQAGISSLQHDGGVEFQTKYSFKKVWVPWFVGVESRYLGTPNAEHILFFSPGVFKQIVAFEREYTRFQIMEVGKITNAKHARLYEKCRQWVRAGGFRISKDELVELCDLNDAQKNNAAELKRRFLDPAIARLEKATTLKIAYTKDGDFYRFTVIDTAKTEKANTDGLPADPEGEE